MTKVIAQEFKGNKMFAVFEVDDAGQPVSEYPVVSFGLKKAKAILEHLSDLQKFVAENDKGK